MNLTLYFKGDESYACGSSDSPFHEGGREHFAHSNSNVSIHKECRTFRFICFGLVPSSVETVSFFAICSIQRVLSVGSTRNCIEHVYSHFNMLNVTTTSSFLRNVTHVPRNMYMDSCIYADFDPATSPGYGTVHFTSSSFTP